MAQTIFTKILAGEIPCHRVYEDDKVLAFLDINPLSRGHLLIIPKQLIPRVSESSPADEPVLGHLIYVANVLAKKLQLAQGFRLVINNGPHASESVPHLHVHLLAKRQMNWPPG